MRPVDETIYEDPTSDINKNFAYKVEWTNEVREVESLPDVGEYGIIYYIAEADSYDAYIWSNNAWMKLGTGIVVDTSVSDVSTNPVANKAIKKYVDDEVQDITFSNHKMIIEAKG